MLINRLFSGGLFRLCASACLAPSRRLPRAHIRATAELGGWVSLIENNKGTAPRVFGNEGESRIRDRRRSGRLCFERWQRRTPVSSMLTIREWSLLFRGQLNTGRYCVRGETSRSSCRRIDTLGQNVQLKDNDTGTHRPGTVSADAFVNIVLTADCSASSTI